MINDTVTKMEEINNAKMKNKPGYNNIVKEKRKMCLLEENK